MGTLSYSYGKPFGYRGRPGTCRWCGDKLRYKRVSATDADRGDRHDATLSLYRQLAAKHENIHVFSFDSVTNPAEVAEDMAIAVLAKRWAP